MKPDGGPAFPHDVDWLEGGELLAHQKWTGMTLRDYFAGEALPSSIYELSLLVRNKGKKLDEGVIEEAIARMSYSIADAMLLEREKP